MITNLEARNSSTPEISLVIAVESRMDGQLFKNALGHPRLRFKVISCAVSKTEIASSIERHPLDIALVSENLQDGHLTGFGIIDELRALSPRTRSIMLLETDSAEMVVDAFRAGAKGVLCRADSLHVLPKCIRAVHSGQIWASSQHLDHVLDAFASASPLKLMGLNSERLLTRREQDVVGLVVEGLTNREVAQKLGLTEHTISNYLFKIYEKLGISSRVELVLFSLKKNR